MQLRYIVEQSLTSSGDRLSPHAIGIAALSRNDNFDPRTDPIVRIEVGRVRSDLERYYGSDGRSDPVRISIPKGKYVASFELRNPPSELVAMPEAPYERREARYGNGSFQE